MQVKFLMHLQITLESFYHCFCHSIHPCNVMKIMYYNAPKFVAPGTPGQHGLLAVLNSRSSISDNWLLLIADYRMVYQNLGVGWRSPSWWVVMLQWVIVLGHDPGYKLILLIVKPNLILNRSNGL